MAAAYPHDASFGFVASDAAYYTSTTQNMVVTTLSAGNITAEKVLFRNARYYWGSIAAGVYYIDFNVPAGNAFDGFICQGFNIRDVGSAESYACAFKLPMEIASVTFIVHSHFATGAFAIVGIPQYYNSESSTWIDVPGSVSPVSQTSALTNGPLQTTYILTEPLPPNTRMRIRLHADGHPAVSVQAGDEYNVTIYANADALLSNA